MRPALCRLSRVSSHLSRLLSRRIRMNSQAMAAPGLSKAGATPVAV